LLVAASGSATALAAELTAEEERGRLIFYDGIGSEGPIHARVGPDHAPMPARIVPCVSCHGPTGAGRAEGGVAPANIAWSNLTKPYAQRRPDGSQRPPYADGDLLAAVSRGRDPNGASLNPVMPRYEISAADARDLVAFLKRLDRLADPGVGERELTIGTLLPASGPLAPVADAVEQVLIAFLADLNRAGGVYDRQVRLKVRRYTSADRAGTEMRALLDDRVFLLLAPLIADAEDDVAPVLDQAAVPVLGPITPFSSFAGTHSNLFLLAAGIEEQARALMEFAARRLSNGSASAVILAPDDPRFSGAIAEIVRDGARRSREPAAVRSFAGDAESAARLAADLKARSAQLVIYLGAAPGLAAMLEAAAGAGWAPTVLASGASVSRPVLAAAGTGNARLFAAYPLFPSDQSEAAAREFRKLHDDHRIPIAHLAAQTLAFSAARLFVEAASRAGRELSRARIVSVLEGLQQFDIGTMRPLTYGPNRRVGVLGAHVVEVGSVSKGTVLARSWISLEPGQAAP
jgi:ABC-type branched-subunit amino acid transport system substrate-binding protein